MSLAAAIINNSLWFLPLRQYNTILYCLTGESFFHCMQAGSWYTYRHEYITTDKHKAQHRHSSVSLRSSVLQVLLALVTVQPFLASLPSLVSRPGSSRLKPTKNLFKTGARFQTWNLRDSAALLAKTHLEWLQFYDSNGILIVSVPGAFDSLTTLKNTDLRIKSEINVTSYQWGLNVLVVSLKVLWLHFTTPTHAVYMMTWVCVSHPRDEVATCPGWTPPPRLPPLHVSWNGLESSHDPAEWRIVGLCGAFQSVWRRVSNINQPRFQFLLHLLLRALFSQPRQRPSSDLSDQNIERDQTRCRHRD